MWKCPGQKWQNLLVSGCAEVLELCGNFAESQTRHMLSAEEELRTLLSVFDRLELHRITAPENA